MRDNSLTEPMRMPDLEPNHLDIIVERATLRDAASVAPFFDAYRQFYGRASDRDAAVGYLTARLSRGESTVFVARQRAHSAGAPDQIVGFAQLYGSFSSLALCPSLILNDLFVLPEARGLGVGRSLVGACAAFARGIGASSLSLSTQHANAAALALYESLGFVRDEEFVHLALALPASPARSD